MEEIGRLGDLYRDDGFGFTLGVGTIINPTNLIIVSSSPSAIRLSGSGDRCLPKSGMEEWSQMMRRNNQEEPTTRKELLLEWAFVPIRFFRYLATLMFKFATWVMPEWRPDTDRALKRAMLWVVRGVILAGIALGILVLINLIFGITLLELLKLLISASVPVVIAVLGTFYTRQSSQDQALREYLDKMSEMLTDEDRSLHDARPGDSLSTVARARTLTLLPRLNGYRKGSVLRFLYEANLITLEVGRVLDISGADLRGANLEGTDLHNADLRETNLEGAWLRWAILDGANLAEADLRKIYAGVASFKGAKLRNANLEEAILFAANLHGADLSWANLQGAYLQANFDGANLERANLRESKYISPKQLEQSDASLTEATMPNGQKYEEWVKAERAARGTEGQRQGGADGKWT